MRLLHPGVLALCLLQTSPVCGLAQQNPRYIDREVGFSFQPPTGWLLKEGLPRPLVAYVARPENGFAANFSVNLYANPIQKGEEAKFLQDIKIEHGTIYERKRIRLAGQVAHAWRTRLNVPKYPNLENRMIVCFYRGRAYELTFTFLPETRKKYEPIYQQIVASFRFEEVQKPPVKS